MKNYYLLNGKIQSGPFSLEELKKQEITDKFMVWSQDMSEWKKVFEVDELKDLIVKMPPKPPSLIKSELRKKAFYISLKKGLTWFLIVSLLMFISGGGFGSKEYLERIYSDSPDSIYFSNAEEIRWVILPLVAIYLSFPIAILVGFLRFKYILAESELRRKQVKSSIKQTVFIVVSIPILLFIWIIFDHKIDENEISMVRDLFPYLPLYVLALSLALFNWFYRDLKLKGQTLLERLIIEKKDEEKIPKE